MCYWLNDYTLHVCDVDCRYGIYISDFLILKAKQLTYIITVRMVTKILCVFFTYKMPSS